MKRFLLALISILFVAALPAQNIFFPTKKGTVLTYSNINKKGNVEGYIRQTITDVSGSGKNMTISYLSEIFDKDKLNGEPIMKMPLTITIKDDVMIMDLNAMMPTQNNNQQSTMGKIEISGIPTEIPGNLQVGQTLKDANMVMSMNMGLFKMKTEVNMTNGKCLAIENVTVPAGTYKCHKVTQTAHTSAMKIKSTSTTISWYTPGIGSVKTETFDQNNKLLSSMELISVK